MAVRLRLLLVLLALALLAGTVALNWPVFAAPARLDCVLGVVEVPLGLTLVGLLALAVLAGAAYMASWRTRVLLEARRHAQELKSLRRLADDAEASRSEALRLALQAESANLREALQRASEDLRTEIRQSGNALAAQLGEMDDRLGGRVPG